MKVTFGRPVMSCTLKVASIRNIVAVQARRRCRALQRQAPE